MPHTRTSKWTAFASAVLLAFLTANAVFELAAWMVLRRSFAALDEIQGLLMIWFGFLAAAYCLDQGLHFSVNLVVDRFPERAHRAARRFAAALVAVFGVLIAVYGIRLVGAIGNTLPGTGWPASVQYQPAIVAGVLIAWSAARQSWTGHDPAEDSSPSPSA